eukprot:TRINITY_DN13218_c0_g1_i1.p1 TRINITY_DN13218_c0_g1~~TRINITY_DN13218_c0_g1_i1.p1  ORF type:complete len:163 (-),score=32.54 TRINITY_DN13218_c0_g1_i1:160-648(-)
MSAEQFLLSRLKCLRGRIATDVLKDATQNAEITSIPGFYQSFVHKGLQIDRFERGNICCTWKVPPHLADASGALSAGAVANLIDDVGSIAALFDGQPEKVSVDLNFSNLAAVKFNDTIEIDARVSGHKGGLTVTKISLRNRATGEVVAEGRHILYGRVTSKL